MIEEDLKTIFSIPESEDWFRAVLYLIDGAIEDSCAITAMFSTSSSHGQLAHSAGGLEALRTLREEIIRVRRESFDLS